MIDYKLQSRGSIESVALDGTDGKTLASGLTNETETGLAVDDAFVYWGTDQALFKAPLGGGAAVTVIASRSNPGPGGGHRTHLLVRGRQRYLSDGQVTDASRAHRALLDVVDVQLRHDVAKEFVLRSDG